MMPEVVLQGVNGQPAVDAETGQVVTLEEMLRRRGIMGYKGRASLLNQMSGSNVAPATPTSAVEAALAGANTAALPSASGVGSQTPPGVDPNAQFAGINPLDLLSGGPAMQTGTTATGDDPLVAAIKPDAGDNGLGGSILDEILAGAGVGAGWYAASKWRNRNKAPNAITDEVRLLGGPEVDPAMGTRVGEPYGPNGEPLYTDYTHVTEGRDQLSVDRVKLLTPEGVPPGTRMLAGPADGKNVTAAKMGDTGPKALKGAGVAGVLEDRSRPQRTQTRAQVGARQAVNAKSGVLNVGTPEVIHAGPPVVEATPSQVKLAQQLEKQIRAQRQAGASARFDRTGQRDQFGVRTAVRGAGNVSTAPVDDNGLFNVLLQRIVEAGKTAPAVTRRIGR